MERKSLALNEDGHHVAIKTEQKNEQNRPQRSHISLQNCIEIHSTENASLFCRDTAGDRKWATVEDESCFKKYTHSKL